MVTNNLQFILAAFTATSNGTNGVTFVKKPLAAGATLGDRLRALRLEAGLSVADVARAIEIRPEYIQAIEESRYDRLPGQVYAQQFVRRYAAELQTDVDMALSIFSKEYAIVAQAKPNRRPLLTPRATTEFPWLRRYLRYVVAGLILAGVVTYFGVQAARNFLPPQLTVTSPPRDFSTTALTIHVTGLTDSNATITINDQEVQTSGDGTFDEQIDLHQGLNVLNISAIKKHSSARVVTRQVLVE